MNEREGLDTCGCCQGLEPVTPVAVTNPPGRPALAWRVGTQARFKRTMLARLSGEPALRALTSREDDDPTIALIDAWATTLDVLTFYQERIANENYLRTATERRSILELARAIGYELAPGVSASTWLAFKLETAPGAPTRTKVPKGTKVQSVPGQDEKPQLYETSDDLDARAAWGALAAKPTTPFVPTQGDTQLYLQGVVTTLQVGEGLLIATDERLKGTLTAGWCLRKIAAIEQVTGTDPARSYTLVTLDAALSALASASVPRVFAMRQRAAIFGANAVSWSALSKAVKADYLGLNSADDLRTTDLAEWPEWTIYSPTGLAPVTSGEFTIFQMTTPQAMMRFGGGKEFVPGWMQRPAKFLRATNQVDLDTAYPAVTTGGYAVLSRPGAYELFYIEDATETGRSEYLLSGKVTRLTLSHGDLTRFEPYVRETTVRVYALGDELTLGEKPLPDPHSGKSVIVDVSATGLPAGRLIAATGTDADTGEAVGEVLVLDSAVVSGTTTTLNFVAALTHRYQLGTLVFNANVVPATHGETVQRTLPNGLVVTEVLGSGDGSVPFQEFVLKQTPLTYVSAANASGRATTLEIRVDGVLWSEVPTLYGVGPTERVYLVRLGDDGKATVQFGDGITGARLPTGSENVTALYRLGTGLPGLVDAGQLSLLVSRPPGVKEVTNPEASSGAEDPEQLAGARQNAPLTVLTLDRIVSLLDYQDFARAFGGVGKAAVTLLWTGEKQTVHLTVGLADGSSPEDGNATLQNLRNGIDQARHALRPVRAQGYVARPFAVTARVAVDPAYVPDRVIADVTAALLDKFAFAHRDFAQDVTESEVIAAMQEVDGVVYLELDSLAFTDGGLASDGRLDGRPARLDGTTVCAADLLTLDASNIQLTAKTP